MYFAPRVIYRDPNEDRKNSIIRYIGNRVLTSNKNFLCALTGQTGSGKSWSGISMAELYSKMFNIPFDPNIHVIFSLKELLELITSKDVDKKIKYGSVLVFDEPQIEANARDWQSEVNKTLNQLTSTFRNQRLIIFFATPSLDFIDKQSRILFHGEFEILGYDKNTRITTIKPRFLEYRKFKQDFYRKRLVVEYALPNKQVHNKIKLGKWHINAPSKEAIEIYEGKKKQFTDELNLRLLNNLKAKELKAVQVDKSHDGKKVAELYEIYGDDLFKIQEIMPHLTLFVIEKYVQWVKRAKKSLKKSDIVVSMT